MTKKLPGAGAGNCVQTADYPLTTRRIVHVYLQMFIQLLLQIKHNAAVGLIA